MAESKILTKAFYTRDDVVQIAKDLLGKYLVTNIDGKQTSGIIVETEAYRGADDKACHAYPNKKTKRTSIMFEEGGLSYVYLCYGIHHLFNVVVGEKEVGNAVLIRAIEPKEGIETMQERRNMSQLKTNLTVGPGSMSKALGIEFRAHNALDITSRDSEIWIEDRNEDIQEENMISSRRIGVGYAEECALWDWRFRIKDNKWTSKGKGKGE